MDRNFLDHEATRLYFDFAKEMADWEDEVAETTDRLKTQLEEGSDNSLWDQHIAFTKTMRSRLEEIYTKFCIAGLQAKRLKGKGLSYGTPRQYDPENEKILVCDISESKVTLEVLCTTGYPYTYKYEITLKDGRWWMSDTRKFHSDKSQKWSSSIL